MTERQRGFFAAAMLRDAALLQAEREALRAEQRALALAAWGLAVNSCREGDRRYRAAVAALEAASDE